MTGMKVFGRPFAVEAAPVVDVAPAACGATTAAPARGDARVKLCVPSAAVEPLGRDPGTRSALATPAIANAAALAPTRRTLRCRRSW